MENPSGKPQAGPSTFAATGSSDTGFGDAGWHDAARPGDALASIDALGLIQRLEALARDTKGPAALVFDADGTLWNGDVGVDVFTQATEERLLRDDARQALIAEVLEHDLTEHVAPDGRPIEDLDVNQLGHQLQRALDDGHYPERAATEMQVWAYAGWTERELREHARRTLKQREHLSRIHHGLLPVLLWAREARIRTVIVSASPQVVVEEASRDLGFAPNDIVAGRAQVGAGGYLPALAEPLPYGAGKVHAGRRLLADSEWLAVFGDSGFDAEMLSESKLPVLVRPRSALLERIAELPGAMLFADPTIGSR